MWSGAHGVPPAFPRDRPPQAPSREGPSSLPSPPSPSAWKKVAETPARGSPESEDEHPGGSYGRRSTQVGEGEQEHQEGLEEGAG